VSELLNININNKIDRSLLFEDQTLITSWNNA